MTAGGTVKTGGLWAGATVALAEGLAPWSEEVLLAGDAHAAEISAAQTRIRPGLGMPEASVVRIRQMA